MDFLHSIASCYRKGSHGRASRSEYWYWLLFVFLCSAVGSVLFDNSHFDDHNIHVLGLSISRQNICFAVFCFPSMNVIVRRLHDINRPGWWLILILILSLYVSIYVLSSFPRKIVTAIEAAVPATFLTSIFLLLIPLPLLCKKGTRGENSFGEDPLQKH